MRCFILCVTQNQLCVEVSACDALVNDNCILRRVCMCVRVYAEKYMEGVFFALVKTERTVMVK